MTPDQFDAALDAAKPGEVVTYCTGDSLRGCAAAKRALRAYYAGEVELCQKRVGEGVFEYRAVKRRVIAEPPVPWDVAGMVDGLFAEADAR